MTTALLFPGQGSQFVGMGLDLYRQVPAARKIFDEADALLGWSLTDYCFGANEDKEQALRALTRTEICQPALYTHSAAVYTALNLSPSVVAGHSVGEYSALYACQALSFADGLRLVRRRGELMATAGDDRPGGMAAVLGLNFDAVETVCTHLSQDGHVAVCANYNSLDQVVISGDKAAIDRASTELVAAGARRVVALTVSGAFHSPLMEPARASLAEALSAVSIRKPICPIVLNVSAEATVNEDEIRTGMLAQLTSPVRWAQALQAMPTGATFFEVGPGRVLSGLVRRTLGRTVRVQAVGTADQVVIAKDAAQT